MLQAKYTTLAQKALTQTTRKKMKIAKKNLDQQLKMTTILAKKLAMLQKQITTLSAKQSLFASLIKAISNFKKLPQKKSTPPKMKTVPARKENIPDFVTSTLNETVEISS